MPGRCSRYIRGLHLGVALKLRLRLNQYIARTQKEHQRVTQRQRARLTFQIFFMHSALPSA